jgi:hypothetical protein
VITDKHTEPEGDGTTLVRSSFAVTRAFKGEQSFDALVSHRNDTVSCGVDLDVGVEYLFFVPNSGEIGVCSEPRRKEAAAPEVAALESFVTGRRSELVEPWHFSSVDEGCTLTTFFDVGEDRPQGALTLDGWRPGRVSPNFGRAKLDIFLDTDVPGGELTVTVDGSSYEPTVRAPGVNSVTGEDAEEILRKAIGVDALHLHLDDGGGNLNRDISVSTANLADAGTGAKMLECIGPR